jgi:23S rRNA (uracil1939-C5)-methyltransferase
VPANQRVILIDLERAGGASEGQGPFEGFSGVVEASEARLRVVSGSPYVVDTLTLGPDRPPVELQHHVRSFFQGNRWLLSRLVTQVLAEVDGDRVVDLYAGVGLFAVSLAVSNRHVVAVEGDRFAGADLEANAGRHRDLLEVHQYSVERYLQTRPERCSTALLDPPRTGLSRDAMAGLLALNAPRIVYLSCDVATLARDVKRLREHGYTLTHLEAFDLFPNTGHVETLVTLRR